METTRHTHTLDEARIKDGGVEAGNQDRLCALAETQGAVGKGEEEHMG